MLHYFWQSLTFLIVTDTHTHIGRCWLYNLSNRGLPNSSLVLFGQIWINVSTVWLNVNSCEKGEQKCKCHLHLNSVNIVLYSDSNHEFKSRPTSVMLKTQYRRVVVDQMVVVVVVVVSVLSQLNKRNNWTYLLTELMACFCVSDRTVLSRQPKIFNSDPVLRREWYSCDCSHWWRWNFKECRQD